MKQKLFIALAGMIWGLLQTQAAVVTEQQAQQKAEQFMQGKQLVNTSQGKINGPAKAPQSKSYYVFNVEQNEGFVIVSGDDRTPAILGYSEHGNLDPETAPCNVKWLLNYYEETINSISSNVSQYANDTEQRADIAPLLDTQWGQGDPYNRLSPTVNGQRCVAGCSATALAQVIYYHRWPQGSTASVSGYTTITHNLEMPALPPTSFDWNNMGQNALARLMQYCGNAIKMDYGPNESAALPTNYAAAFTDVFGYSSSARIEAKADYSESAWSDLIYNELAAGRPVVYSGYASEGGHSFVVEGYSAGKFYVNWGWNGMADGYFTLNNLNPTGSLFSMAQTAIVGVQPSGNTANIIRPSVKVSYLSCNSTELYRDEISKKFSSFTVGCYLKSNREYDSELEVGFGLYNDNGLLEILSQEERLFKTGENYYIEAEVTLGSDLPDDSYRIVPICLEYDASKGRNQSKHRIAESANWLTVSGSTNYYVSIAIDQDRATLVTYTNYRPPLTPIEHGECVIDGVNYRIWSIEDCFHATLAPLPEHYSGDLYIPDFISYQNMQIRVDGISARDQHWSLFEWSPELTGLSIAIHDMDGYTGAICNCPKLTSLELRDGILEGPGIYNCPMLESITFPSTCFSAGMPCWCEQLKSIRFLCEQPLDLFYGSDWLSLDNPQLQDIYFHSVYPPNLPEDDENLPFLPNVTVHIRKGLLGAYKHSKWRNLNLVEDLPAVSGIQWDYCGNNVKDDGWSLGLSCGDNDAEMAMRIPADMLVPYIGKQVTNIQFRATYPAVNVPENWDNIEYVFITKEGTDYLAKSYVNKLYRGSWTDVELEQPYTITGEELYVGVGSHEEVSLLCAKEEYLETGIWLRAMGTDINNDFVPGSKPGAWERIENYYLTRYGDKLQSRPLPIRLIIQGENLPMDLVICGKDSMKVVTEKEQSMKVKVRSRAPQLVTSFSLGIFDNGQLQSVQAFDTSLLPNQEDEVIAKIPLQREGRSHKVTAQVLSVNEMLDAIPENSISEDYYILPVDGNFPRKVVMEEVSSTGCGWSPTGIEAAKRLSEAYPNSFIPIAVHTDYFGITDQMKPKTDSYDQLLQHTIGLPSCCINRKEWYVGIPYEAIRKTVDSLENSAIAQITAKAFYVNEDSTLVLVTTKSQFGFNDKGKEKYRIAYVVLENNVGPYNQMNSFSGLTLDEYESYMEWWTQQNYGVESLFNHVARGIYSNYFGTAESTPEIIVAGETYNGQYLLTLPDNVQQKKNVHLAVLLIDAMTGEILNADRADIVGSTLKQPHVIARNVTKIYGEANPSLEFDVVGSIDGVPSLTCEAVESSSVGTYPIVVAKGTMGDTDAVLVSGTLTIKGAPLTVTPANVTIKEGQELSNVEFAYEGWKYGDSESILEEKPYAVTLASDISQAGEYPIYVAGGKAANYEIVSGESTLTIEPAMKGDIDSNDILDMSDVVTIINHIMGESLYGTGTVRRMDVNGDGEVNVGDVILLVKMVLSAANQTPSAARAMLAAQLDDLTKYTAFQFCMTIPEGTTLQNIRLTGNNSHSHLLAYQQTGVRSYKVAVYSMNNERLHLVDGSLVDVELANGAAADVTTCQVLFVSPEGERQMLGSLPYFGTTGISETGVDACAGIPYNLQGCKVDASKQLPQGIYIINNKKVAVK